MSRPVELRGLTFGGPSSAVLAQQEFDLTQLPAGTELWTSTQVRCRCGQVVAVVRLVKVPGSPPEVIVEVQAVDRIEPKPVRVQRIPMRIRPGAKVLADCTAHGRLTLDAEWLLDAFHRDLAAISARERTKPGRLTARPDGFPVGHDLESNAMTLAECVAWLGWPMGDSSL